MLVGELGSWLHFSDEGRSIVAASGECGVYREWRSLKSPSYLQHLLWQLEYELLGRAGNFANFAYSSRRYHNLKFSSMPGVYNLI